MVRSTVVLILCFVVLTSICIAQTKINKTPAPYTSPASGQEMYKAYCASCHGLDGKGTGPAASAMKAPIPDLTQLSATHGGKFPSDHVLQVIRGDVNSPAHGSKDMPVWGPVFMSVSGHQPAQVLQRTQNLTKYIESLQKP
jgi:mono/diheme cytochrome c family protein